MAFETLEPSAIKLGTTDIKKVYLGSNQVRGPTYRTFTISWTEQSNMSSGWTYSDDAAGLTAGSTEFDTFFGYSAVRLSTSGTETATVSQTQSGGAGKLSITNLGTLTSGDNVMIKFPVRGIKMTKSGSTVTLSITDGLDRESEGYQYYAHCTGTLASPGTPKDAFYLGTYKGYNNSSVLKSWSGKAPTGSSTSYFCTWAKANGSGYNIIGFYQRMYINALYMMKYGNPNSRNTIGYGNMRRGAVANTGGTDSETNATYGVTNGYTTQMKLFGLEDRMGNVHELLGGAYTDSNYALYTQLTGWSGTASGGESTGATLSGSILDVSSVAGTNKGMLAAIGGVSDSTYSTYYSSMAYANKNSLLYQGGYFNSSDYTKIAILSTFGGSGGGSSYGSRLMYLQGLT